MGSTTTFNKMGDLCKGVVKIDKCECYHTIKRLRYVPVLGGHRAQEMEVSECWGTKDRDLCGCNGDRSKCDFYPEVREKAGLINESTIKQLKNVTEQLELFNKAETEAIKAFVKQMVGKDNYNQKVNEIYQSLKSI